MRELLRFILCGFLLLTAREGIAQDSQLVPEQITLLDAVRSAITRHPALHTEEQQLQISRALRQQASSVFDDVLAGGLNQSHLNSPLTKYQQSEALASGIQTTNLFSNLTDLNFGSTKLLRDGITFGPTFDVGRTTDNLTNAPGVNSSHLGLQITLPLLRGRGREVVTSQENAAGIEIDATLLDLRQTVATLIANAASSYWSYVAAQKSLAVAMGSEQRGRQFLDNVQSLIDADQSPRSDIRNVEANLADRQATRILAQENALEARQALALNMGLGADSVSEQLSTLDEFPEPAAGFVPADDPAKLKRYRDEALNRRFDLQAADKRVVEAKVLSKASFNLLKPQLDLTFSTGYSGLAEGTQASRYLYSPFTGVQGLDAVAGVVYQFPHANSLAKGKVAQATALLRQAEIHSQDLSRTVASSVTTSYSSLRNAVLRLEKARKSVAEFQAALEGEHEKLTLGIGSVVDILTVEDRLTTALQGEVQAQMSYAVALVTFRYATGTFFNGSDPSITIQKQDLTTFPFSNGTAAETSADKR
jgi:outer membrane protein TolC